jgi:transposase-like protein
MNAPERADDGRQTPQCPFCRSRDTELYALFGSLLSTSQYYCKGCRTVFEWIKWEPTTPPLTHRPPSPAQEKDS